MYVYVYVMSMCMCMHMHMCTEARGAPIESYPAATHALTAMMRGARLTRPRAPVLPPAQSCNNALGVAVAMLITFFKRMKRA